MSNKAGGTNKLMEKIKAGKPAPNPMIIEEVPEKAKKRAPEPAVPAKSSSNSQKHRQQAAAPAAYSNNNRRRQQQQQQEEEDYESDEDEDEEDSEMEGFIDDRDESDIEREEGESEDEDAEGGGVDLVGEDDLPPKVVKRKIQAVESDDEDHPEEPKKHTVKKPTSNGKIKVLKAETSIDQELLDLVPSVPVVTKPVVPNETTVKKEKLQQLVDKKTPPTKANNRREEPPESESDEESDNETVASEPSVREFFRSKRWENACLENFEKKPAFRFPSNSDAAATFENWLVQFWNQMEAAMNAGHLVKDKPLLDTDVLTIFGQMLFAQVNPFNALKDDGKLKVGNNGELEVTPDLSLIDNAIFLDDPKAVFSVLRLPEAVALAKKVMFTNSVKASQDLVRLQLFRAVFPQLAQVGVHLMKPVFLSRSRELPGLKLDATLISPELLDHYYALQRSYVQRLEDETPSSMKDLLLRFESLKSGDRKKAVRDALLSNVMLHMSLEALIFLSNAIPMMQEIPNFSWGGMCFPSKTLQPGQVEPEYFKPNNDPGPRLYPHGKLTIMIPFFADAQCSSQDNIDEKEFDRQLTEIIGLAHMYVTDNIWRSASLLRPCTTKLFLSDDEAVKLSRGRAAVKTHADILTYLKAAMNAALATQTPEVNKVAKLSFTNAVGGLLNNPRLKPNGCPLSALNGRPAGDASHVESNKHQIKKVNDRRVSEAEKTHNTAELTKEQNPLNYDRYIWKIPEFQQLISICPAAVMLQQLRDKTEVGKNCFIWALYLIMALAGAQQKLDQQETRKKKKATNKKQKQ